jgi:hypothetical protein
MDLRRVVEPLFIQYGVDVVFNGHEHFYQRIKPQNGITYFVSGAGGQLRRGDIKRADFTAVGFDQDQSFMLVEIADKEMTFRAISRTGKVIDQGAVIQRASGEPPAVVGGPPAGAPPTKGSSPSTPKPSTSPSKR